VVALPLREVFAHPTIAELAELVARGERSDWSHIPPAPQQAHYALSYAQQRLWMLHHMEGATAYNMPEAHLIEAEIDASVLERALQALVARHESLRTAFVSVEGEPRQQILTELPFSLAKLDLRASLDPQGEARAIVERDATQPFDLAGPPLLRASLVLLPEGRSLFALTLHHIVGDGWSGNILFRELLCLYEAFLHGRPDPLKPLRIQYKDFAAWQNARSFDAQERYWMARLCGMPERLDLPYDFAPGGLRDFSGGQESLDLDPAVAEGLRQLAARRRTTLSNVVLALFQLMLFHWTRQDDLCVGMSVANRSHPDLENLIGFFVNILPIRCTLSADMELDDLLRLVAARSQEALEHQDYPFDLMIRQLNPQRQANRQPLVNVIYGFQNFADVHVDVAPARPAVAPADATVDWQPFEFGFGTSKFDLTLFAWESEDGLRLHFEYDSTLFLAHTIRCQLETMQHFAGLIATSSHSS
jgi:hypothetical protein